MEDFESKTVYRRLFDLAARMGSLEGYLYGEEKVDQKYLPGWLDNVARAFELLPLEIKQEISSDCIELGKKICILLKKVCGEGDAITHQAETMVEKWRDG